MCVHLMPHMEQLASMRVRLSRAGQSASPTETLLSRPQAAEQPRKSSAALEAAEAQDGFKGEMARRAREKAAREKARARRAEARRAIASGDASAVGPGPPGGEEEGAKELVEQVEEHEQGVDENQGLQKTRDVSPEKVAKRTTLLEISNSIVDELED